MASKLMFQKPRLISFGRDGKATSSKVQHQIKRSYLKFYLTSLAMLLLRDECTANPVSCHIASVNSKLRLLRQSKGNSTDNSLSLLSAPHHSAKTTTWPSTTPASPPQTISKMPRPPNVYAISMETATRWMITRTATTRKSNECCLCTPNDNL